MISRLNSTPTTLALACSSTRGKIGRLPSGLGLRASRKRNWASGQSPPIVRLFRVQAANISSDQNSPLFNLQSPVLLGLIIDGQTLENLRDDLRMQLPQNKAWYEYNLTLGLSGAWSINERWSLLAGLAYTQIKRKDYQERIAIEEVKDNLRLDAGILWSPTESLGIYFKGFATTHNTLGYEPIAYNRRTSSTFDNKYGELSLGFVKIW